VPERHSDFRFYRLVYFQIDRDARNRPDLPAALRKSNVLSAIFRVGAYSQATGAPAEYALRLLEEPVRDAGAPRTSSWSSAGANEDGVSVPAAF
jgi:hypothetical protein